tara:strand:+ start:1556 stop:1915 length:360 start_codon:yes stop_codon:yes gene_type:complete
MAEVTPEFIDRINNPSRYPYITNDDGTTSTHRMAAEVDEDGNWYVFPTIQYIDGELVQFKDVREAMKSALDSGNFILQPSKKEALSYAEGGYKVGTPMESFDPLEEKAKTANTFKEAMK